MQAEGQSELWGTPRSHFSMPKASAPVSSSLCAHVLSCVLHDPTTPFLLCSQHCHVRHSRAMCTSNRGPPLPMIVQCSRYSHRKWGGHVSRRA